MSDTTGADNINPPVGEPTPVPDSSPAEIPEPPIGTATAGEPSGGAPAPEAPFAPAPEAEPEPKAETLVDAIADLLQMFVNYLRQETAGVMRDKVVLPGQQLGQLIAFAMAAAFLLALGIGFLAVAGLLVLAYYLGWPGALALIGVVLLIGAAVFTYLKVRSIQT